MLYVGYINRFLKKVSSVSTPLYLQHAHTFPVQWESVTHISASLLFLKDGNGYQNLVVVHCNKTLESFKNWKYQVGSFMTLIFYTEIFFKWLLMGLDQFYWKCVNTHHLQRRLHFIYMYINVLHVLRYECIILIKKQDELYFDQ